MYRRYEKICSVILLLMMCASLGILMYVGRYNHPTGDDYYYGAVTKEALRETGSLAETFQAAGRGVAYQYYHWQGTYSAMFLMYLPPNIFGENAYKLVTAVILLLFTGGTFYLLKALLCDLSGMSGNGLILCGSALVMLCIQTVQFAGESYFWYNGSMYYTGYFALSLFFFGMVVRYLLNSKKRYIPALMVLGIFLAGGNYVSLLPDILILCTVCAALVIRMASDVRRQGSRSISFPVWDSEYFGKIITMSAITALMIAGLLVSAAAPGNLMREEQIWEMSAWKAVLKSIRQGFVYTKAWCGVWWLITAILVTPCLWHTFQINSKVSGSEDLKAQTFRSFRFRHPAIVAGYLFGIFCSMSCPTFYAMNSTGPARAVAIVYYGFMFFSMGAYAYVLGALCRWFLVKVHMKFATKLQNSSRLIWAGGCAAIIILMSVQIFSGKAGECTAAEAVRIIVSGEGALYEKEYRERLEVLQDDAVTDVVFAPYTVQPKLLYVGDFTDDIYNENNVEIAKYFGKNSVMVDYTLGAGN